jgi:hypothetical protein
MELKMRTEIISEEEQSLDDLIVRARSDSELKRLINNPASGDDVLIFGSGKEIFMLYKDSSCSLQKRESKINGFALHGNHIYDICGSGMGRLFDDKKVFNRDFVAICEHKDMFFGTTLYTKGSLIRRLDPAPIETLRETDNAVGALCSYRGHLLAGDVTGRIFYAATKNVIVEHNKPITALYSYDDALYYASDEIWVKLPAGGEVQLKVRRNPVCALSVYNGRLVDAGPYGVYDTKSGKRIVISQITAMTVIPYSKAMQIFPDDKKVFLKK